MNICVYGASSNEIDKEYILKTEELGNLLAKSGYGLVYGGGTGGLMGAVSRGALKAGGYVLGVAPSFFKEMGVLEDKCTEFIYTETMRERKQIMEDSSDAFIVTPGGIGTYEEFFEILTLKQLSRHTKPIVLYNIRGYYDFVDEILKKSCDEGFVNTSCLDLYKVLNTPEEVISYLENYSDEEIKNKKFKY